MTRLAVGTSWNGMSASDHSALVAAFHRLTVIQYARNFDGYSGETITIELQVQSRGNDRLVRTMLRTSGSGSVPIAYRLRQTRGAWRIIDVFYKNSISQLAMRRSDFAGVLAKGGAPGAGQPPRPVGYEAGQLILPIGSAVVLLAAGQQAVPGAAIALRRPDTAPVVVIAARPARLKREPGDPHERFNRRMFAAQQKFDPKAAAARSTGLSPCCPTACTRRAAPFLLQSRGADRLPELSVAAGRARRQRPLGAS